MVPKPLFSLPSSPLLCITKAGAQDGGFGCTGCGSYMREVVASGVRAFSFSSDSVDPSSKKMKYSNRSKTCGESWNPGLPVKM